MKYYKYSIIAFIALAVVGTPWLIAVYPSSTRFVDNIFTYVGKGVAAVFFQPGITSTQLHVKYNAISQSSTQPKVRIMIVPGHEPGFGGTEYKNLKEREMTVDLAQDLQGFFQNNSHYEVIVARDKNAWNSDLESYFKNNWDDIAAFVKTNKEEMIHLVNDGSVHKVADGVIHNTAPQNTALRLYGINKWNNENHVDIAIHIHFNDYPRSNKGSPGQYSGIAIYVPEKQYSNSATTRTIADAVFRRLSKYNALSNLPKETAGVVEDQDLIAIGSNNTLDAPSMLIEYGYIYEPQFADSSVRDSTLKDLAFQTFLGVQDFFGARTDASLAYDTLMLPYSWNQTIDKNSTDKNGVLALQSALTIEGLYPPSDKSKNDCPRSGKFGPCTLSALSNFQNKYGIKNEKDTVGEQTQKILNNSYSAQLR